MRSLILLAVVLAPSAAVLAAGDPTRPDRYEAPAPEAAETSGRIGTTLADKGPRLAFAPGGRAKDL